VVLRHYPAGAQGGGHTPYISCELLSIRWTLMTYLGLWKRSYRSYLMIVTRRTGPRKCVPSTLFPAPPGPTGWAGMWLRIPFHCPCSGPRLTYNPDGSPLNIGSNKRGPIQGMSMGGPWTGAV